MIEETCDRCSLAIHNNFKIVKPRGNPRSGLFFVGEAPGYKERKLGYTFVGKAGNYLQGFVNEYGLKNFSYFTNAIKCRPPRNETPSQSIISTCRHKLLNELNTNKPAIIVLLGNSAVNSFYNKEVNGISKLHGKIRVYNNVFVVFGFHPSYIMREDDRDHLYHDLFKKIKALYRYNVNKYIK